MELHGEQVVPRQCRISAHAVVDRSRNQLAIIGMHVVAVNEVEAGSILDTVPERVLALLAHLVPAHVGHLQPLTLAICEAAAKKADIAVNQPQAVDAAVFFRALHQRLHANADRQHRFVLFYERGAQQFITAQSTNLCHAVANRAHPGKDYPIGLADFVGIVADHDAVSTYMLVSLMCIELMMNGAFLALVSYNRFNPLTQDGQVMVLIGIVIAAAEAAVGLAIAVNVYKFFGEVRTDRASEMKG